MKTFSELRILLLSKISEKFWKEECLAQNKLSLVVWIRNLKKSTSWSVRTLTSVPLSRLIFLLFQNFASRYSEEKIQKKWQFHASKRGFLINFLFQILTVIFLQKRKRMSPTVKFMVPFQTDIGASKMPPSVNKIIPAYQNADSYRQRRRNYLRMLQQTAFCFMKRKGAFFSI